MLSPICAMKIEGKNREGKKDDTCDHGLSRSWKVEMRKTKTKQKTKQKSQNLSSTKERGGHSRE